jgi:hypothetical protein
MMYILQNVKMNCWAFEVVFSCAGEMAVTRQCAELRRIMSDSIDNQMSESSSQATESLKVRVSDGDVTVLHSRPASRPIPPKFYRIGEVVEYSGMSRQTIHNYTTMGLLHESCWTNGGHRLYDESVFRRLDQIAELKAASKSIEDIRDLFRKMDPDL